MKWSSSVARLFAIFAAAGCAPPTAPVPPPEPPPAASTAVMTPSSATPPPAGSTPPAPNCETVCKGKITNELESALVERTKKAHRCYDNALANDPKLDGKVVIDVVVGRDGSVCSSKVKSKDAGFDAVAECIAGTFSGSAFPAPEGTCADVVVPIALHPKK